MPKKNPTLKECTETCRSSQHVSELISSITLPFSLVSDKQLACFLKSKCYNFPTNKDPVDRTVLHIAAACGRRDLCLWLCKCSNVNIDEKDLESGYSALSRSILSGHINVAVALIQMGADLNIKDREDHFPLDYTCREINQDFVWRLIYSKFPTKVEAEKLRNMKDQRPEVKSSVDTQLTSLRRQSMETHDVLSSISYAFASEVYTWGTNLNYTSGFGAENSKINPEYLEFFEKKNEIIVEVCIHKYHTLFVGLSGNAWSCGLGKGGRLGLASEDTVLIPQKVVLTSASTSSVINSAELFCISAAVGQDHSVFLCNDNQVLTCGTNTYHQLGVSPPVASVNKPQVVNIDHSGRPILGIAASTYHSVVWTEFTIFTCGLHAGQLGHPFNENKTIAYFKKVSSIDLNFTSITHVAATEGATVIVTIDYIFLLSNYKCQKIHLKPVIEDADIAEFAYDFVKRKRELRQGLITIADLYPMKACEKSITVLKVSAYGGTLDSKKIKLFTNSYHSEELKIVVLLSNGSLFVWNEYATRLIKVHFLPTHEIYVTDVVLNSTGMLICTKNGHACIAELKDCVETFSKPDDGYTLVKCYGNEKETQCYLAELKRIQNAYRAICIFSDPKGHNFAMLQHRSMEMNEVMPKANSSTYLADFERLYRETNECDPFHDVIYQLGRKSFAAHKYIMASCSKEFAVLKESNGTVHIHNIHPEIFEQILLFAYTGSCRLFHEGPCSIKIQRMANEKHSVHNSPVKFEDPLRLAIKAAEEFKITRMVSMLECFWYEKNACILCKKPAEFRRAPPLFNRLNFKTLYDIKLQCQDGHVLHAHKCILIARMEYFKSMLCGNWIESTQTTAYQMAVSSPVLLEILEFLYTDEVTKSINKKDVQFWCSLLVAADQFLLKKLNEISEKALAQCLDVRNVADLLLFADAVQSEQLKRACYEFICINLSSCLASRILDVLNDTLLNDLSTHFRNFYRMRNFSQLLTIPVYSNACRPEDVIAAENSCPIDWDVIFDSFHEDEPRNILQTPKQKKKRKPAARKSSTSESECTAVNDSKTNIRETKLTALPKYKVDVRKTEVNTSPVDSKKMPAEEWVEVDRQLKSVKSRLKAIAAVRDCPGLIEQKENFVPLVANNSSASPNTKPLEEGKMNSAYSTEESPKSLKYTIDIDLQNLTPRLSQAARKRLHRVSESGRAEEMKPSSPENVWQKQSFSVPEEMAANSNVRVCWGAKNQAEAASFSSIMASEKKEKTLVIKETKRIETKSLHLTQMEDQAIQELIAFYNANNIDDEHITVRRIIHETYAPQWVTK